MKIEQIAERLLNVSKTTNGFKGDCPICDKGNGKQHLSLIAGKTKEGTDKTGLKCWKGTCDGKDIMQAIGLELKDLYDNPEKITKQKAVIETVYDYKDESGKVLFQAIRFKPKDFRQRRIDENGKEVWNLQGVKLVPYNLPALIANKEFKDIVFICEGEKDCNNLALLGFLSTCNPMGAGKWKSSFNEYLKDFPVIIIADKDEVGRKHAEQVATELFPVAKSVKVIEMPDIGDKKVKDYSDWLACEDENKLPILELVDRAELWKQKETILDVSNCINDAVDIPNPPKVEAEAKEAIAIEAYYDIGKKEYLLKNQRGAWLPLNESQFKKELRSKGMSHKENYGELSDVDKALIKTRNENDVYFAGRVAGYMAGYYSEERILVTDSPIIIEPSPGEWKTIKKLIDGLLNENGLNQQEYFYGWLKIGYEALRAGERRAGQALVICGERESGKSFLQSLITKILGGRCAKPVQYMFSNTSFNSDLFTAEHLMLADEVTNTDIKARRSFGQKIKDLIANPEQRCHAKGKEAIMLKPFWRLSITLNDSNEDLMILPPLNDSLEDKMMIFRGHKETMPMPTITLKQRSEFLSQLYSELPAFLDYLLKMEIPKEMVCNRYGIKHFHHSVIVGEVNKISPEARLLDLIDFAVSQELWVTSKELKDKLLNNNSTREDAKKLLEWGDSCGIYLGRIEKQHPERVCKDKHKGNGAQKWIIKPFDNNGGLGGHTFDNSDKSVTHSDTATFEPADSLGGLGGLYNQYSNRKDTNIEGIQRQGTGLGQATGGDSQQTLTTTYPKSPTPTDDGDLWGD